MQRFDAIACRTWSYDRFTSGRVRDTIVRALYVRWLISERARASTVTAIPASCFEQVIVLGVPQGADAQPKWIGTGSLLRHETATADGSVVRHYIVTAKHITIKYSQLYMAMPNGHGILVPFVAGGQPTWRSPANPDVDIAVVPVPAGAVQHITHEFRSDASLATVHWLVGNNVREGAQVFALGPMIVHTPGQINYVRPDKIIARCAIISDIRETLGNPNRPMALDGTVWNGWSGAPVIVFTPEGEGDAIAHLVGVISSYTPYADVLTSPITGAQMVLQYNSGLFSAYVSDNIVDVLGQF